MRVVVPEKAAADRIPAGAGSVFQVLAAAALVLLVSGACAWAEEPLPPCEWCGAFDAPDSLTWQTEIAGPDEPGEPLVIEGKVLRPDGSPAAGVLLYAYHTNAEGVYPRRGDETGNGRRHGYLRGWLRTDDEGRYRIETIRPGGYPESGEPAHVHMTLTPPGEEERRVDSVMFDGDPRLTERRRSRLGGRGGSGVVRAVKEDGAWYCRRDILLEGDEGES